MKILKYALLALGGLVILAGIVLAYVAATFDPNQYKPKIVQAVKEKTQRTLRLDGDIALSFWPSLGAKVGKAALSARGSDKEFASVEEARVSVKLLPLLSKQVIVDTVHIRGLRANIVKEKDGRTNVDDLAGPPAQQAPAATGADGSYKMDVAGVEIRDATIHYTDQSSGTKVALSQLDLKTGRIAPGVPIGIELSVHAQGERPGFDLQTALKTKLAFDPGVAFALDDLVVDARGAAADIKNLVLKAAGNLTANMKKGEFVANQLNIALTGTSGQDALDIKLDMPRLSLAADKAAGDKVSIVAKVKGPAGAVLATLSLPGIEGTAQAFRSGAATLDLDVSRGSLAVKAKLASPVTGNVKAQQLSLPQLKASLGASGPNIPGQSITGELAGSLAVDGAKQHAQASLAGRVADSSIKAQVSMTGFAPFALAFNIDMDQLDVDRYLPPKTPGSATGASGPTGASSQKQAEQPFDLSALRALHANGNLHIGALKANNVRASDVRMAVKAGGGRLDINPLTSNFYQGTLSSAIAINAAPAVPAFAVKHSMTGVNLGAFLKDLANNDTLEGKANVTADLAMQGGTVSALKKALSGSAAVKLADGAVKGIDVAGSIRNARAKLGALRGEQAQASDMKQKTDFSELTATFNIENGIARNNDLSLKSPLLRVGGEGEINLGEDTLNYLVKAAIVGTAKGQDGREAEALKGVTVPVRVTGSLAAPSYKLELGAMATESAKQAVTNALQKRLGVGAGAGDAAKQEGAQPGGSTRDRLRGILGR